MDIGKKDAFEWATKTTVPLIVVFWIITQFVDVRSFVFRKEDPEKKEEKVTIEKHKNSFTDRDFFQLVSRAEANQTHNELQDATMKEIRLECLAEMRATRVYIQNMQSDLAVIKHKLGVK